MNGILRTYLKKLAPVRKRIQAIWLFGSRARGDHGPDSDYDLLIVVDKRDRKILNVVYSAVSQMQMEEVVYISAKVFPRAKYEEFVRLKTPFMTNVHKEGRRIA